jgi:hypothetical protein
MKRAIICGALLALSSALAFAQTGAVSGRSTLALLNTRIPEVSFQRAPLDQVMDWVSDYMSINVVVRWQVLEDNGIERDKPISIRVKNLRLSQVLWMIMNEAGGSDVKLAYRASGNLLVMSTGTDLGQEMLVRVYDVTDLLVEVKRFTNAPRIDLSQQTGSGTGGGGQNIFGGSSSTNDEDDEDEDEDNEDVEELIELIISTVEPDTWVENGGLGTIRAFGRQLVVRNNILVHQALGGPVEEVE